jgi:uncharacterized protein (TIGR02757 family)
MDKATLKEFLDEKATFYNTPQFIEHDPIQIPHLFTKKEDIEITAFIMATLAWGNRISIINNGHKLVKIMGNDPYEFIQNYKTPKKLIPFVHRTFNAVDLDFFFRALQNVYTQGGFEQAFSTCAEIPGMKGRISNFRNVFLETPHDKRSEKHISNPLKGSAAKRINMFLRWMVRKDACGVDFGIWDSIPMSELYIPLDVHTGNIARKLDLLTRDKNDWQALEELQAQLREFDPLDPVKYDFALFGIGANEKELFE